MTHVLNLCLNLKKGQIFKVTSNMNFDSKPFLMALYIELEFFSANGWGCYINIWSCVKDLTEIDASFFAKEYMNQHQKCIIINLSKLLILQNRIYNGFKNVLHLFICNIYTLKQHNLDIHCWSIISDLFHVIEHKYLHSFRTKSHRETNYISFESSDSAH